MDYQRLTQTILDLSSKRWDWNQGALSVRNPQVPKSQRNISRMIHTYTQMLHVWYICTYIWVMFAVNVDTYSITTWSIWDPAPQEFLPCFCWLKPYPHGWFMLVQSPVPSQLENHVHPRKKAHPLARCFLADPMGDPLWKITGPWWLLRKGYIMHLWDTRPGKHTKSYRTGKSTHFIAG